MSDAPVVIRQFGDALSAHLARALLEAHDIPAVVLGDDAGGMQPSLTWVHGVRLAVRHEDAVRALALLDRAAEDGELADGDDAA